MFAFLPYNSLLQQSRAGVTTKVARDADGRGRGEAGVLVSELNGFHITDAQWLLFTACYRKSAQWLQTSWRLRGR